jgi:hypothetical protein
MPLPQRQIPKLAGQIKNRTEDQAKQKLQNVRPSHTNTLDHLVDSSDFLDNLDATSPTSILCTTDKHVLNIVSQATRHPHSLKIT